MTCHSSSTGASNKYMWDNVSLQAARGDSVTLERGDRCCNTDHPEGSGETNMRTNTPTPQKTSRTGAEPSQSNIIHFVCRDCDAEELVSGLGIASVLARKHELDTGHETDFEVIDG